MKTKYAHLRTYAMQITKNLTSKKQLLSSFVVVVLAGCVINGTAQNISYPHNLTTGSYNTAFGFRTMFSNTTGSYNTVSGYQSLYSNTTGRFNTANGFQSLFYNTSGSYNTASGYQSLFYNTEGSYNTAHGFQSLYSNRTGVYNTAVGSYALYYTKSSNNTATGHYSLFSNTDGQDNTGNGLYSLYSNTNGGNNTATGSQSLYSNTSGSNNTANGLYSLKQNKTGGDNTATGTVSLLNNTTGAGNTANGVGSLLHNTTGNFNTALGLAADVNAGNLTNATAIGYAARATASNQVMLGNSAVTVVRTFGSIIWASDGRFKKNMKENVPGLDFIKQLRPLTYTYDVRGINAHLLGKESTKNASANRQAEKQEEEAISNKEKKTYTGFIAQEVEATAQKLGFEFSGVYKLQNEKDIYGLSYAEFVVPLVKAVQQLAKQNEDLQKQINDLKDNKTTGAQTNASSLSKVTLTNAYLEQNIPNPFFKSSSIRYNIPINAKNGQLIVTDNSGKTIQQATLNPGKGVVNVDASSLSGGTYNYTLLIDGKLIESKKMIVRH